MREFGRNSWFGCFCWTLLFPVFPLFRFLLFVECLNTVRLHFCGLYKEACFQWRISLKQEQDRSQSNVWKYVFDLTYYHLPLSGLTTFLTPIKNLKAKRLIYILFENVWVVYRNTENVGGEDTSSWGTRQHCVIRHQKSEGEQRQVESDILYLIYHFWEKKRFRRASFTRLEGWTFYAP